MPHNLALFGKKKKSLSIQSVKAMLLLKVVADDNRGQQTTGRRNIADIASHIQVSLH